MINAREFKQISHWSGQRPWVTKDQIIGQSAKTQDNAPWIVQLSAGPLEGWVSQNWYRVLESAGHTDQLLKVEVPETASTTPRHVSILPIKVLVILNHAPLEPQSSKSPRQEPGMKNSHSQGIQKVSRWMVAWKRRIVTKGQIKATLVQDWWGWKGGRRFSCCATSVYSPKEPGGKFRTKYE